MLLSHAVHTGTQGLPSDALHGSLHQPDPLSAARCTVLLPVNVFDVYCTQLL